jgi:hypothetical protein
VAGRPHAAQRGVGRRRADVGERAAGGCRERSWWRKSRWRSCCWR